MSVTEASSDLTADQAELEAVEAERRAAEARARVDQLQHKRGGTSDASWRTRARLRLSTLRWARIATVLAVLGSVALFTASGYMIQQGHNVQAGDRNRAEFVAAARQAAVTLMSIDFNNPQESVQRIVDNSTGSFRQEFEGAADDFIKMAKDAKVTTKATATAAAVESITVDSAVALVSVSSTVTNAAGADEAPRSWRLTVDLQREGDQIKMAKVEFVP